MIWVGITGGIASGKSTISEIIRAAGYPVIQADKVVHSILDQDEHLISLIQQLFGSEVIQPENQKINRKKLGEIVFRDPKKLQMLEGLLHPRVKDQVASLKAELASAGNQIGFYEIPLLFEKKLQSAFDLILVVTCSEDQQLLRLMKRDQLSQESANFRLRAQLPMADKTKEADFVIVNDADRSQLEPRVLEMLTVLKKKIS